MAKAKDRREAAELLDKFAEKYPDSDYRDLAFILELTAWAYLNDASGQVKVAEQLLRSPEAEPTLRVVSFVTLISALSPYVRPDDPEKDRKLADLDKWVQCGREALAVQVKAPSMPQENFEKQRLLSESMLDRTAGYVALLRTDYGLAASKLEAASKLNPQDTLTYLWLSHVKLLASSPDLNTGVFYLARATDLSGSPTGAAFGSVPQKQMADYLKRVYVLVHGSDKGLEELKTLAKSNTAPPPGFNVLPKPKTKHHYGSAIAATAIVGLLVYGFAAHPDLMGEIGRSFAASVAPNAQKFMVFGGPGHRVYLGCLSCSEVDTDSVFNPVGPHGSKVSSESIWNTVSQYGSHVSPYSACNELATDPPVIVDQSGNAYGRLTMNHANPNVGLGARLYNWLASEVCQN